jgi:amino acid transporter
MQRAMTNMGTAILLAAAVLSAIAVGYLRGNSLERRTPTLLWLALVFSLAVATALLVVLKAKLVPITPINFSIIVLGIIYFGVVECLRIHRRLAALR